MTQKSQDKTAEELMQAEEREYEKASEWTNAVVNNRELRERKEKTLTWLALKRGAVRNFSSIKLCSDASADFLIGVKADKRELIVNVAHPEFNEHFEYLAGLCVHEAGHLDERMRLNVEARAGECGAATPEEKTLLNMTNDLLMHQRYLYDAGGALLDAESKRDLKAVVDWTRADTNRKHPDNPVLSLEYQNTPEQAAIKSIIEDARLSHAQKFKAVKKIVDGLKAPDAPQAPQANGESEQESDSKQASGSGKGKGKESKDKQSKQSKDKGADGEGGAEAEQSSEGSEGGSGGSGSKFSDEKTEALVSHDSKLIEKAMKNSTPYTEEDNVADEIDERREQISKLKSYGFNADEIASVMREWHWGNPKLVAELGEYLKKLLPTVTRDYTRNATEKRTRSEGYRMSGFRRARDICEAALESPADFILSLDKNDVHVPVRTDKPRDEAIIVLRDVSGSISSDKKTLHLMRDATLTLVLYARERKIPVAVIDFNNDYSCIEDSKGKVLSREYNTLLGKSFALRGDGGTNINPVWSALNSLVRDEKLRRVNLFILSDGAIDGFRDSERAKWLAQELRGVKVNATALFSDSACYHELRIFLQALNARVVCNARDGSAVSAKLFGGA